MSFLGQVKYLGKFKCIKIINVEEVFQDSNNIGSLSVIVSHLLLMLLSDF